MKWFHNTNIKQKLIALMMMAAGIALFISATIALAHSLQLKVVAEGVETCEELTFLRNYGCDEIQGYYLSAPLPAYKFVEWIGKSTWKELLNVD